jgi:hypothetical protein
MVTPDGHMIGVWDAGPLPKEGDVVWFEDAGMLLSVGSVIHTVVNLPSSSPGVVSPIRKMRITKIVMHVIGSEEEQPFLRILTNLKERGW